MPRIYKRALAVAAVIIGFAIFLWASFTYYSPDAKLNRAVDRLWNLPPTYSVQDGTKAGMVYVGAPLSETSAEVIAFINALQSHQKSALQTISDKGGQVACTLYVVDPYFGCVRVWSYIPSSRAKPLEDACFSSDYKILADNQQRELTLTRLREHTLIFAPDPLPADVQQTEIVCSFLSFQ